MKLAHAALALLWIFVTTAEAQYRGSLEQYGSSDLLSPSYRDTLRPPTGGWRHGYHEPDEVLIYGHPDQGVPSQAPYLRVPIETTPGPSRRGYYSW